MLVLLTPDDGIKAPIVQLNGVIKRLNMGFDLEIR